MVRINYNNSEQPKISVSSGTEHDNSDHPKISVSSDTTYNSISLGGSVSFVYNQAKDWAVKMDGLVMNEDYSSKYYAGKSKENYENVLAASKDAIAKLGEVVSAGEIAVSNISQEKNNSISDIRNSLAESVASIGDSLSDSLSSIDLTKENAISDIHSTKDDMLSVIGSTKDSAILGILESKDNATEEIGIELSKGISQITSVGNSVVNDANLLLVSANMEAIKSNVNNIDNININARNINSINTTAVNIDALKNTAGLIDELATKADKSLSNIDDQGKQMIKQYAAEASYDLANSETVGVMKLFGSTGSATDGTMTQAAITNALSAEVSSLAGIISSKANTSDLTSHTGNKSNPHAVTKTQVGLGNVDNTSDANKPISNATQTALNAKANDSAVVHKTGNETISGDKTFSNTISAEHGKFGKKLATYRYKSTETPTTTYYWYKIFQSSTSSQCVNFEIMAHSDNNYPQFAKYTVSISNYSSTSTSIVVYNHGKIGATPSIKVAIDAEGNVYLQANCIWDCVLTANNAYGTATIPYTNMGYGAFGTPVGFTSIGMITSSGALRYLKQTGAITYSTPEIDALATKSTADASGNVITSTYRKISDSYTKTEVDTKIANSTGTGDGKSITKTSDNKLQAVAILDAGNTSIAIKTWTGKKAQFRDIATKDPYTLYHITDDADVTLTLLNTLYPVGAIYIGTMATCPLQVLGVGNWSLKAANALVTSVDETAAVAGNGMALGLTDGTNNYGMYTSTYNINHLTAVTNTFGKNVGGIATTGTTIGDTIITGVTTDSTNSGLEATVTSSSISVNIWERIS